MTRTALSNTRAETRDKRSSMSTAVSGARGVVRRCLACWRAVLLTTLLVASVGWFTDLFYVDYYVDRRTDNAAAHDVTKAAADGVVALLSYAPDSLSRDIEDAKLHVTNDFQGSLKQFTEQVVAPAAQRGQLTTTVQVIRVAVAELHPTSAVVLLFINQKTTSKQKPEPVKTTSCVRIGMTYVDSTWLISKFDSV